MESNNSGADPVPVSSQQEEAEEVDFRLYVPETENWNAKILTSWDKVYCFSKNPGQDYYHLIQHGEIYIQKGDEIFCLTCGLRDGLLTRDRLFWQKRTGR